MWVGPRVGPRWSQSPIWGLELSSNMTSTSEWQVVMKHLKMWPQTETCGECNLHTGFGRLSTKNNSFSYWLHIEMKAFWIYWLKYDIKTNFSYLFLFPNMVMRLLWITLSGSYYISIREHYPGGCSRQMEGETGPWVHREELRPWKSQAARGKNK